MARGGRGWPVCPWASIPVVMGGGSWGTSPGRQVRTKGLVKYCIISAKTNMFAVKAKPLLLSMFTLAVRINLLYWESCVTSTKAFSLSLFCCWYSSVGGHVQLRASMVYPKCDIRFWEVCPCLYEVGEAVARHEVVDGADLREKCAFERRCSRLVSDRHMWGCHVACGGSGQGVVWTTKSQGFPPLGGLFQYMLCFCCAGKLCYSEDRIGLDEETKQ